MMGRIVIDIACNGRVCDVCNFWEKPFQGSGYAGYCELFDENLDDNGDGEALRCSACMIKESNIPDHVIKAYKR